MSDPILTLAFSLAATVPSAAIGWGVARLCAPLVKTPRLKSALWSGALALPLVSAAAVPLWRSAPLWSPPPAPAAAPGGVTTHFTAVTVHIATPAWGGLVEPLALGLSGVALGGAMLALGLLALDQLRLRRLVRTATPEDGPLARFVAKEAQAAGLTPPAVRISDKAGTAVLAGLRRPCIVLPRALAALPEEALHWICAHELAHLRRGDNAWLLLDRLMGALLWFNPFVLAALARRAEVRETLCDAAVLRGAGPDQRRRYAATLLQALRLSGAGAPSPAFIRNTGASHAMRLSAILTPPAPAARRMRLATLALAGVGALSSLAVSGALAQQLDKTAHDAAAKGKYVIVADRGVPDGKAPKGAATRPDVVFRVVFTKAGERLAAPTVVGQFGEEVGFEVPKLMRVALLAQKPGPNGKSFTSAKMAIFQNDAWQPAKEMTMDATLSATPSFEYSVDGTPYRFVVMPRLVASPAGPARMVPDGARTIPDGAHVSAVKVVQPGQRVRSASVTVTAGKAVTEGGTIVHEGSTYRIEGGTTIYTISPRVKASGDPEALMIKVNGVAKPAGFDVNTVPAASILRIETAQRGTVEAKAMGAADGQTVVNIVTKP